MLKVRFVLILAAWCHCALSYPYDGSVPMNVTHNFIADHQTFYFGVNSPTNNTVPLKKCEIPAGYQFHTGFGAYKYHTTHKRWSDARKICIEEGAHLASPRSKAEEAILKGYISGDVVTWAWVGYHAHDGGEFYSVLDEPVTDAIEIHKLTTRIKANDTCTIIAEKEGLLQWPCDGYQTFICKIACEEY